jgi:dTDP-glucose pyrophosphorylase
VNNEKFKILRELNNKENHTQMEIADVCNISLGKTNKLFNSLISDGLIKVEDNKYVLEDKAIGLLEQFRVDNAIIMAAGFGSRFVPLSYETPKGLLEVFGERMIERQIYNCWRYR